MNSVAKQWEESLKNSGYEHHGKGLRACCRLRRYPRVWRRIFKYFKRLPQPFPMKVFEVGCGGGKQLIPFVLQGHTCMGIDCSAEVLERARRFIAEATTACGTKADVKYIHGDFLEYGGSETFDLVFHVGVLEHFLDEQERMRALQNMFALVKPGGWVVSIVPSGMHPLREKMKQLGLGGYNIPEVDYTDTLMQKELERCGGKDIIVLPHNIFGYWLIDRHRSFFVRVMKKVLYYCIQLLDFLIVSRRVRLMHSSTLIGMARK